MKIGILTLPLHTNYGGILQAYALQTVLERMGHDVVVFQNDYMGFKKFPFWRMPIIWSKRLYRKCTTDSNIDIFLEQTRKREFPVLSRNTRKFIQKHIYTYSVKCLNDIPVNEFDAIVVGSDQVWRPAYVWKMWNTDMQECFLRFAKDGDIKRVAYAASFGVDDWCFTPKETDECKQLAQLFDAISVREDSGVKLCLDNLKVCAKQMLDPTMLLTKDDYVKLLDLKKNNNDSEILFSYILDNTPEKKSLVKRIAEEKRMRVDQIAINQDKSIPVESRVIPPVEEWLECFYNANMVVTDSFHGCVFSIIFGKPFVTVGNIGRGLSRFTSLLDLFSLKNHLLMNSIDYSKDKSYNLPDQLVDRLSFLQKDSLDFLSSSLKQ